MNPTRTDSHVDFKRFGALRERSHSDAKAALHDVADEFESMFIETMLKAAHETDGEDGLFDSSEMKTYREMLDGQLAQSMAKREDFGFEAMLGKQFAGKLGDTAPGVTAADALAARLKAIAPATSTPAADGALAADREPDPVVVPATPARPDATPAAVPRGTVDKAAFVHLLTPAATAAAKALGVAPRAIVAQAALESGWGRHVIRTADGRSSHNYFGIKAGADWHGATVKVPTTEFVGGRAVSVNAKFRAYPDLASAFRDYVDFIGSNPRYRAALAKGADADQYARQLEAAGYATDPHYAHKIMAILSGDGWGDADADTLEVSN